MINELSEERAKEMVTDELFHLMKELEEKIVKKSVVAEPFDDTIEKAANKEGQFRDDDEAQRIAKNIKVIRNEIGNRLSLKLEG